MTSDFIICTGGDARYFELLQNCIRSIRERPEGRDVRLGVLDLGLSDDQRAWLKGLNVEIAVPDWDIDFPGRSELPAYYKALTSRPFLPKYFPGSETYLWIDADAWVQDWSAIELLLRASANGSVACVPEIDRAYRCYFHAWEEFHSVVDASYVEAFGERLGMELARHPLINSGVFALKGNSPSWAIWAQAIGEGFANTKNFLTEQAAFNLVIYRRGVKAHFLPTWCNWAVHHAMPCWDVERECFVEPLLPHHKLGILHLTIYTKHEKTLPIRQVGGDEDGQVRQMRVRFGRHDF